MRKTREENDTDLLLFGGKAVRLPLAEAMRVMLVFTYGALKEFPRYEKNGLALEIRTVTWQIHKQILSARRFERFMKTPSSIKAQCDRLERLCIDLEALKLQVRVATDRGYITLDVYAEWAGHLVGIGSQLGGWLNSAYDKR